MRFCRRFFLSSVVCFSLFLFFFSLASCLRLSRIRYLHRPRSFYSSPCSPQGLPPISDSGSSVDVFAQYFKRLLMEIAIMPSVSPPSASQFFRKAWFSMAAALRFAFSLWSLTYFVNTFAAILARDLNLGVASIKIWH